MPFGLVTACSTYVRLMRIVLKDIPCSVYFDNIFIVSNSWDQHMDICCRVLERLRGHGLTANPLCHFGYNSVTYLGFKIHNNFLAPLENKLEGISNFPLPTTKKLLRSFLGSINFYRKFFANSSDKIAKLTEKLQKKCSEPLQWSSADIEDFKTVRGIHVCLTFKTA